MSELTERQTVVLTKDEKRAVTFLAFVLRSSRSNLLRDMRPREIVVEYHRIRAGLGLTDAQVDRRLRATNDKTPDA